MNLTRKSATSVMAVSELGARSLKPGAALSSAFDPIAALLETQQSVAGPKAAVTLEDAVAAMDTRIGAASKTAAP